MANYQNLLATIAANIYTNGNQEVTAAMVKSVVDSMVGSLGYGYQFRGAAAPSDNPGTPDQRVYYVAKSAGTYTNFGNISVSADEVAILKWDSAWSKEVLTINAISTISPRLAQQDAEIASFEQAIRELVENYPNVTIYGNVTNNPNNEDIDTNENNQLQFADRSTLYGMGYKILRRDKTFAEQVTDANTIYEIRYDFDLDGGSITLPSGCAFLFNGGSLANGTITGANTFVISEAIAPILKNITLDGTFASECAFADWFYDSNDKRMLMSILKFSGRIVLGKDASYSIDGPITIKEHRYVNMNGATITMTQANQHGIFIQYANDVELFGGSIIGYGLNGDESSEFGIWVYDSKDVNIHDMYISNFSGDGIYIAYGWDEVINVNRIQNIHIGRCVVDAVARNGISIASGDDIFIEDCTFKNITKTAPKAGIDIEPETGVSGKQLHINNVHINNCRFTSCINCIQVYSSDFNYSGGSVYINNIYCLSGGALIIENNKYQGGLNVFVSNITMNQPYWMPVFIVNPSNTRVVSIDGIRLIGFSDSRSEATKTYYDNNYGAITIFAQKPNGGTDRDDLGRVMITNVVIEDSPYNDKFDNIVSIGYAAEEYSGGVRVWAAQTISDVSVKGILAPPGQIGSTGFCSFKNTPADSSFTISPCMIKYPIHAASATKTVAIIKSGDCSFSFKVLCVYRDAPPQYFTGEATIMSYGNTLTLSTSRGTKQIDRVRLVKDNNVVYLDFRDSLGSAIQYYVAFESVFGDIVMPCKNHAYSGNESVLVSANL